MEGREDYQRRLPEHRRLKNLADTDPNRLDYHLMPPAGWLNDPNGLCQLHGVNHIYYQYSPFTAGWGTKYWGHYTTKDWIRYHSEEPFLFPDQEMDRDGVYSGSALVEQGKIHYFYTGNVKLTDREYDYILEGREQNTIAFESEDGCGRTEKECLLTNEDYPDTMTKHVRDPKVYKKDGVYYMVLGARDKEDRGCVLMYRSPDLRRWSYFQTIYHGERFGYMWECPDLFELDGQLVLAACPQGLEKQGYDFANVYQAGYFPLEFDFKTGSYLLGEFRELDRGFDFYAPQTFEDESGRRILIAWMGIPDADYDNEATVKMGWQHALTMPRELKFKNGRLYQTPLEEFKQLRMEKKEYSLSEARKIGLKGHAFELEIRLEQEGGIELKLLDDTRISYKNQVFTLEFGKSGCGRTKRSVKLSGLKCMSVYVDQSSIEIFINEGEEVFSARVYDGKRDCVLECSAEGTDGRLAIYPLAGFHIG